MMKEDPIKSSREAAPEFDALGALMRRAQDGDQQAYTELLRALVAPIGAYLARRYPGISDRDDVMQESLVTLHKIRHTYEPGRPFRPWLFAIVRHRALDYLRKHGRIQSREVHEELALKRAAAPETGDMGESDAAARALLSVLAEREQEVLRLLKIEHYSVKDVAGRLGLSESNVKVIASRSYEKLRRAWKDLDPDEYR